MTPALQKAIDSLRINDVFLQRSESCLSEDFLPKFEKQFESYLEQLLYSVSQTSVVELTGEEGEKLSVLHVTIECGVRWVDPEAESKTDSGDEERGEDKSVKARVEGTLVAEYIITEEIEDDSIEEFAHKNAGFHVWPYWREYLSNQCSRMNLPKLVLPAVQFNKPSSTAISENAEPASD